MRQTELWLNYRIYRDLIDNIVCSCVYKLNKVVKTNQIWQLQY